MSLGESCKSIEGVVFSNEGFSTLKIKGSLPNLVLCVSEKVDYLESRLFKIIGGTSPAI